MAQAPVTRRSIGGALLVAGLALQLVACQPAAALACPGMRGYALQQCLREERKRREAEEGSDEQQQEQQRLKYEQPGELVTLPSGLQYREISVGSGPEALSGLECDISYTVYRLSSGGYYKYSGGGTPVYMWSVGYGQEGRDDLGDTYRFRLGDPGAVPSAVAAAMLGMRAGGRRRVLVPPGNWTAEQTGPPRPSFGAARRWDTHRGEALLFEAQLVRVRQPAADATGAAAAPLQDLQGMQQQQGEPFRLPAPPSPYSRQLPEPQ